MEWELSRWIQPSPEADVLPISVKVPWRLTLPRDLTACTTAQWFRSPAKNNAWHRGQKERGVRQRLKQKPPSSSRTSHILTFPSLAVSPPFFFKVVAPFQRQWEQWQHALLPSMRVRNPIRATGSPHIHFLSFHPLLSFHTFSHPHKLVSLHTLLSLDVGRPLFASTSAMVQ